MRDLDKNVQKLSGVNNRLVAFNHSFGALLTAITLQKTCVEVPLPSPPPKKVPVIVATPAPVPSKASISPVPPSSATTMSKIPVMKAPSALPPRSDPPRPKSKLKPPKQQQPLPPPRTFHWPKGARAKIPPKYQSASEVAKLERILFVLGDSLRGMSIGELVKTSNIGVIQAKDMLQTLTKLELIKCKREKHGFIYSRV
ncbi:Aste57867_9782 [Aphanomyces stellatus]|uniref:Aste57867_9782 protein n=1 Tax=Aphanomyces stellatus TaxID=120398 RepID=A0A485KP47_9STRA|nr:hypothetical protein As57867_009743 [Aphanomyces stellatus]VFT86661.1 Aste57867_9782 [Aphanomyces stellatus]